MNNELHYCYLALTEPKGLENENKKQLFDNQYFKLVFICGS